MFNSKRWACVTEQTYGYKCDVITGSQPPLYYTRINNKIGKYIVLPAFGDFVRINKSQSDALSRLFEGNTNCAMRVRICADTRPEVSSFDCSWDGYVHHISYLSYSEWYERLINGKFRNQIRQGQKSGLVATISHDRKSILDFWEMHANLRMRKFSQIPQPKSFFLNLYESYIKENRGFVISAFDRGANLIAGIVVLIEDYIAYYKFAASSSLALNLRPNNFLLDRLVQHLDQSGIKDLNLGYTGASAEYQGLRRYKRSAGATEKNRYSLTTSLFSNKLNPSQLNHVNREVKKLIGREQTLETINEFSEQYYRLFV